MPRDLKRYYGAGHFHFITFSCYGRLPGLSLMGHRDLFLRALEKVRQSYELVVLGFVVMPEHVHLLLSEPRKADLSVAIKALKQSVSRRVLNRCRQDVKQISFSGPFWQARFYDFNVWSERKRIEKLKYMHRNPVNRGLVGSPEEWRWSSFRHYSLGEEGIVQINLLFPPSFE